jgi:hypothetical protein
VLGIELFQLGVRKIFFADFLFEGYAEDTKSSLRASEAKFEVFSNLICAIFSRLNSFNAHV